MATIPASESDTTFSTGGTDGYGYGMTGYGYAPQDYFDVPNNTLRTSMLIQAYVSTALDVRVFMRAKETGLGYTFPTTNSSTSTASLVISLVKAGQTSYSTITPTITHLGGGMVNLALTSTHLNTLGVANLRLTHPFCYTNDELNLDVVSFNPHDSAMGRFPKGAAVTDGSNTATTFKTDLVQVTLDYWKDAYITFTSGNLNGQVKKITGFNGTTKFITVANAFTATPTGGDTFYIVNT